MVEGLSKESLSACLLQDFTKQSPLGLGLDVNVDGRQF